MRLHAEGRTHSEIARLLGSSPNTIGRGFRARGIRADRFWRRTRRRHGYKLYGLWRHLLRRCQDRSHPGYAAYGGKGVRFAQAWQDFDGFYDWAMSHGYEPGRRLERIHATRDFTPANCRWVELQELHARRPPQGRPAFLVRAFGERKGQFAWARDPRCRVKQPALRDRLRAGWPPEEAISAPPGSKPSRLVQPPRELRRPRGTRAKNIDWDEARALYRQGLSEPEVARRLGAKLSSIKRGFTKLGVRRRKRPAPTLNVEWRRLQGVWRKMLDTARSQSRPIGVAREWREFDAFHAWARASGARRGLWLSRKNRRRGFSPSNCAWVQRATAMRRWLAS